MLLFFSEHCPHCKMLLDTIKRHDADRVIKLLSIEALKSAGRLPTVIHSVPALMTPSDKKIMFGKTVFDFLLLPGSGVLLKLQEEKMKAAATASGPGGDGGPIDGEPLAFSLGSGYSDVFSSFDEKNENSTALGDRIYTWTSFQESVTPPTAAVDPSVPYQEETRGKISLPDIEYLKQQRDMDLRGGEPLINLANMPQATPTRIV